MLKKISKHKMLASAFGVAIVIAAIGTIVAVKAGIKMLKSI
ncbi:hypothetical protein [Campylobacter sp. CNRCH_2013_0671h]|nr:hypothetical protein [Campylobacter sp. CNRCH_2013_0671h]